MRAKERVIVGVLLSVLCLLVVATEQQRMPSHWILTCLKIEKHYQKPLVISMRALAGIPADQLRHLDGDELIHFIESRAVDKFTKVADVIVFEQPRRYADYWTLDEEAYAAAFYELLRQMPKDILHGLCDGKLFIVDGLPEPVRSRLRMEYSRWFLPEQVWIEMGSRAQILASLEKALRRPPTAQDIALLEMSVRKRKREIEAFRKLPRVIAIGLSLQAVISVYPPGKRRYCPVIAIPPSTSMFGAYRQVHRYWLQPINLPEEKVMQMLHETLERIIKSK